MKKTVIIILAMMIIFAGFPFEQGCAQETSEIKVIVDGLPLESDQPPILVNSRVMVPFRSILNALYADVDWIGETQTVVATKRFQTITLSIGSNEMYVNGEAKPLDSPAILVNSRTLVPVRAISEGFGAEVTWDGETKTVYIKSAQKEHYISDHYITEKIKSDDGQHELLKVSVSYPQIRNDKNNPYIDQLNETLKSDAQKRFESLKEEYIPSIKEFYNDVLLKEPEMLAYHLPYEVTQKFDITYDRNDILSIVNMLTWWTGGAHPNSTQSSVTYDLKNGKELALTDIFDKPQDEIKAMVIEAFTKDIDERPEYYFEDAKDTVAKEIENAGFYLEEDGIAFYFNPYDIAPYVAGYPTVKLNFDSKYGFFDRFLDNQNK
ncbi:MAG: DUF4163 domain-containing protein [Clostridiaceae bacterium]|nr:DUF4163 domain-containing protein [Clostridiaceae bacterium]